MAQLAALNQTVDEVFIGDNWLFSRDYPGPGGSVAVSKLIFLVKVNETDADGAAVAGATITTALTTAGQITDNGATSGRVRANWRILSGVTNTLTAGVEYVYAVKGIFGTLPDAVTIERGIIKPLPRRIVAVS